MRKQIIAVIAICTLFDVERVCSRQEQVLLSHRVQHSDTNAMEARYFHIRQRDQIDIINASRQDNDGEDDEMFWSRFLNENDSASMPPTKSPVATASPVSGSPVSGSPVSGSPVSSSPVVVTPTTASPSGSAPLNENLVEIIQSDKDLSTLYQLLIAADYADAYASDGPFTVFAPTNEAFRKVDQDVLNLFLTDNSWIAQVQNLLDFFVSEDTSSLVNGQQFQMRNSENVVVSVVGSNISVTSEFTTTPSNIVQKNIPATNGVLNKVDEVLIPAFVETNIIQALQELGDYGILLQLIDDAGLTKDISTSMVTLFAPDDDAFNALPTAALEFLSNPANVGVLRQVLLYHLLPGLNPTMNLKSGPYDTLEGSPIQIEIDSTGTVVVVNGDSNVIRANILGNNGLAQGIDTVLVPPDVSLPTEVPTTAAPTGSAPAPSPQAPTGPVTKSVLDIVQTTPELSTLSNVVEIGQFGSELNGTDFLTLFGPTNDAFTKVNKAYFQLLLTPPWILHLQDILSFHTFGSGTVLEGDLVDGQELTMLNDEIVTVQKNGDTVILTSQFSPPGIKVLPSDVFATNGIVHELTGVLLSEFVGLSIIAAMQQTDGFTVFLQLVQIAGLGKELSTGVYTVFAPTDAAFALIPNSTIDALKDPANVDKLTALLQYHIVAGVHPSVQFTNGTLPTLEGAPITIEVTETNGFFVNNNPIIQTDILANNGIIQAVGRVLQIPAPGAPVAAPTATTPIAAPVQVVPTPVAAPVASTPTSGNTIANVIESQPNLSTLTNAVEVANLKTALSQPGTFTMFAPVNAAFDKLNQAYLARLLTPNWILHLQDLLLFHVTLAAALYADNFSNNMIITMINLENVTTTVSKTPLKVTFSSPNTPGSSIIEFDLAASNGVVQEVNEVFLPEYISTNLIQLLGQFPSLSTTLSLINSVPDLAKTLTTGAFTILAPTNDAWNGLPNGRLEFLRNPANVNELRRLLQYQTLVTVLPTLRMQNRQYVTLEGSNVTLTIVSPNDILFNDAQAVLVNALANNGIVIAINGVLSIPISKPVPPAPVPAPASPPVASPSSGGNTVNDVVAGTDNLSTLESAIQAAGLASSLETGEDITLFAPVNSAFDAFGASLLQTLLQPQWIAHLRNLLLYHLTGKVKFDSIAPGQTLFMFNDETVKVGTDGTGELVLTGQNFADAGFVDVDLIASNGYVHEITGVLIPAFASITVIQALAKIDTYSTLSELLSLTNLSAVNLPSDYTILAPTDSAFGALSTDALNALYDNAQQRTNVILNHIVPSVLPSATVKSGNVVAVGGATIKIKVDIPNNNTLVITYNEAKTVQFDILGNNGIAQGIDEVLIF